MSSTPTCGTSIWLHHGAGGAFDNAKRDRTEATGAGTPLPSREAGRRRRFRG
jgi:hypothetical protein